MKELLKNLLESQVLTEEVKEQLQEEWTKKLEETREQIREEETDKLREEFSKRYEHDKSALIESVERMMTDTIEKELTEFQSDVDGLAKKRVDLQRSIRESQKEYDRKFAEHADLLKNFVMKQMTKELTEFNKDRRDLKEKKVAITKKIRENRTTLQKNYAERLNVLEKFVVSKLRDEIHELNEDHKLLIESRVKLAQAGKQKIKETQKKFISRSAELVETTMKSALKKEFSQFREDMKQSRENNFGRRIFEAFAVEYMTSYFAEGSKVKMLEGKIEQLKEQSLRKSEYMEKAKRLTETAIAKKNIAEEKVERGHILHELLDPLGGENKQTMEELLSGVKTENLRESYKRHLPYILGENKGKKEKDTGSKQPTKKVITEATGDRKNAITETVEKEKQEETTKESAEIHEIMHLAGIK